MRIENNELDLEGSESCGVWSQALNHLIYRPAHLHERERVVVFSEANLTIGVKNDEEGGAFEFTNILNKLHDDGTRTTKKKNRFLL